MEKIFALISKNEYCINWKNSFVLEEYKDEKGELQTIDWNDVTGFDDVATLVNIEDIKEFEDVPEWAKFAVSVPDGINGHIYFETKQEALAELWGNCPDDYRVEQFTQAEAAEELEKDLLLQREYENKAAEGDALVDFVLDNYAGRTREYKLAWIIAYGDI